MAVIAIVASVVLRVVLDRDGTAADALLVTAIGAFVLHVVQYRRSGAAWWPHARRGPEWP